MSSIEKNTHFLYILVPTSTARGQLKVNFEIFKTNFRANFLLSFSTNNTQNDHLDIRGLKITKENI
jgi:hypothetical protein